MDWEYDVRDQGEFMDIYDHNGDLVETLSNDKSGFEIPTDIYEVMVSEVASRGLDNPTNWQTTTIVAIAANNIEAKP